MGPVQASPAVWSWQAPFHEFRPKAIPFLLLRWAGFTCLSSWPLDIMVTSFDQILASPCPPPPCYTRHPFCAKESAQLCSAPYRHAAQIPKHDRSLLAVEAIPEQMSEGLSVFPRVPFSGSSRVSFHSRVAAVITCQTALPAVPPPPTLAGPCQLPGYHVTSPEDLRTLPRQEVKRGLR